MCFYYIIMFTTANNCSDNLGKPNKIYYNSYTSPLKPSMDVSLVPVKNPNGNMNYITVLDEDETLVLPEDMRVDFDENGDPRNTNDILKSCGHSCSIHAAAMDDDDDENKRRKNDIFYLGKDSINAFYIGSVTVVGLYILFRILQKTK